MPCQICNLSFNMKPCEHSNGIVTKELIKINNFTMQGYIEPYIESIYKDLHLDCPCKECLIKMMCMSNQLNKPHCGSYYELIGRSKPIFDRCHEKRVEMRNISCDDLYKSNKSNRKGRRQ